MRKNAIVAGTGFEGRADVIRAHCCEGKPVRLEREPNNPHDPNAVAVYLPRPVLFGLLGTSYKQIGYIKAGTAKSIAAKMDKGVNVTGRVHSFWAPPDRDHPRVTIEVTDEI